MAAEERPHGYARYKLDGCRCYVCAWAVSRYNEHRQKAITAGTWRPWANAAPIRAHVQAIRAAGLALDDLTKVTGVGRGTLNHLLWGTPAAEKIRSESAAVLLSYRPRLEDYSPGSLIDPTGTRRRIQALVVAGWPLTHLAARLGLFRQNFVRLLTAERVTVAVARSIRDLYDQLWRADPVEGGATPTGAARARKYAAERQWAPVGVWDDDTMDDPASFPDWTGKCGTPEGYRAHYDMQIMPACQPCRHARARYRWEQGETKKTAALKKVAA
ncbi:hypothetical protein ACFV2X_38100 [Streptomyces sp. NPDC059679]|uniref:hypothetical protein n=1 Tax=Streptomyces sp. NPDC059679 TaxID=3346903 RepID=UPI0036B2CF02